MVSRLAAPACRHAIIFANRAYLDQNQVSTSLFYENDAIGVPISLRTEFGGRPVQIWAPGQVNFNKRAKLQVDRISNSWAPSRPLVIHDAIPLGIAFEHQLQQPFRFADMRARDLRPVLNKINPHGTPGSSVPPPVNGSDFAPPPPHEPAIPAPVVPGTQPAPSQ